MISNLPLNLPEARKKPETKVISLSSSIVKRYKLCIGNNHYFDRLADVSEEYVFIVPDVQLSLNVLKEQLFNGVVPSFIIYTIDHRLSGLSKFKKFLRSNPLLQSVPLFVYTDTVTHEIKQRLRKVGGIDDIITPDVSHEAFEDKFNIARSIREMARKATKEGRIFSPGHYINYSFKRVLDITIAGTALILLSPLFLLIAVMIKIESKGPVFYISYRAGSRYRIFKFYKFRTMVPDADKQVAAMMQSNNQYDTNGAGPVFFKVTNDPRVTGLGAFLRNTSLDEIPQLLNVIIGDMSLVGNRPLPLYEAATLTTDDFAGRFIAPAGITGLWQIKKRGNKDMSVKERISLDINYAEKHSVLYDMWILANTPGAMRQKNNV